MKIPLFHDIKHVEGFEFLGRCIGKNKNEVTARIGSMCSASNIPNRMIYNLSRKLNRNFFRARVDTVLKNIQLNRSLGF